MSGDDAERQGGRQTIQSVDRAAMLVKAIADSRQPPTVSHRSGRRDSRKEIEIRWRDLDPLTDVERSALSTA
jgi:hypothetical protein